MYELINGRFDKVKEDMDPAIIERLSQINQRILIVENKTRERQQSLHAFSEHVPAIFSELVEQII